MLKSQKSGCVWTYFALNPSNANLQRNTDIELQKESVVRASSSRFPKRALRSSRHAASTSVPHPFSWAVTRAKYGDVGGSGQSGLRLDGRVRASARFPLRPLSRPGCIHREGNNRHGNGIPLRVRDPQGLRAPAGALRRRRHRRGPRALRVAARANGSRVAADGRAAADRSGTELARAGTAAPSVDEPVIAHVADPHALVAVEARRPAELGLTLWLFKFPSPARATPSHCHPLLI